LHRYGLASKAVPTERHTPVHKTGGQELDAIRFLNSHNAAVPRRKVDDLPAELQEVVEALRALAGREGITRTKIVTSPLLLGLSGSRFVNDSDAERARATEDSIRTQVNAIPGLSDRALLVAGFNIDGLSNESSYEARIRTLVYSSMDWDPGRTIDADSAIGRFRGQLIIELAWRLLGGAPTYGAPRPPSDDLDLVRRLRRQHQDDVAVPVLKRITETATDERDRRDAWHLLATVAYERGNYDLADYDFQMALEYPVEGAFRGGKLAMAIDRYAKRLTDQEEYDRALAIVEQSLSVFFEGRWLWRRYGCVKWYAGQLLDAYSALTHALAIGYPASRVFHARGQVLAELGQYERAIEELSEALQAPRSELSQAIAVSARAFAIGMSEDLESALKQFHQAELIMPKSGWLHYWRAICLREHGLLDEAGADLEQALCSYAPALNRQKREHAEVLVSELGEVSNKKARVQKT
jgi:tetratricopeptide (TPR) repeat protein